MYPFKQRNDSSIIKEAINNRLSMQQWVCINKVWLVLGVLFISDLMVLGQQVIKAYYKEGIEDGESISIHY